MRKDPQTTTTPSATTRARARSLVGWVLAPATEEVPRHQAVGATILRIMLGFLWLWNVNWKVPPDFGEAGKQGLYKFTAYAVSDPVFPPYSFVVEKVVLPNLAIFRCLDPGCGPPGDRPEPGHRAVGRVRTE